MHALYRFEILISGEINKLITVINIEDMVSYQVFDMIKCISYVQWHSRIRTCALGAPP